MCFCNEVYNNSLKNIRLLLSCYLCCIIYEIMKALAIFLGGVGVPQVILVVVIILLLFGGKKIPELMKGLGSGIKEFKNAAKDEEQKVSKKEDETTKE